MPRPNDIPLLCRIDGLPASHFRLREFANADGLAIVHPSLVESLERTRRDLCREAGETVWLIITSATSTEADLARLAARLGWVDEGGAVSRDSKHLARCGGIAADLVASVARTRERIPQAALAAVCRRHFDYVKADYSDGHVHADNRHRARR